MSAGAAPGGARSGAPEAPARPPRLAFLGLGWIGGLRLEALEKAGSVQPVLLCDLDSGRLHEVGARFPEARLLGDGDELLRRAAADGVDGIVVATPNALHASQARAAAESGIPAFVQKPLGVDEEEVESVLSAFRRHDVPVSVDYSYRWMEGARALRGLVRTGELGRVHLVDAVFHNAYGPDKAWCYDRSLSGGGALLDLGVHLLDLAFWIFGEDEPRDVRGWSVCAPDAPGVDRFTAAELRLADGVHVRMVCSWEAHAGRDCDFRFTVFGSEGGAELRSRDGSFYDFELGVRRSRTEEVAARDSREWMDRGIVEWARGLQTRPGFDAGAETNLGVARAVDRIYEAIPRAAAISFSQANAPSSAGRQR